MAQYVTIDGTYFVQLDEVDGGPVVPVTVGLSLEGGTLVKLPQSQIDAIAPTPPENYPLPASQVTDLKAVTVSNFPSGFSISNFPNSYNVGNLPATFPLPSGQEALISGIKTWTDNLARGFGAFDANTLRVVQSRRTPTYANKSVSANASEVQLVASNVNRVALKIYNDSDAVLYVGIGFAPNATTFSFKLFKDGYFESNSDDAGVEYRGIWASATGAARITEGTL